MSSARACRTRASSSRISAGNRADATLLCSARKPLNVDRQMHDEVSETENLRKNLAVERMIVEGCDILLDVNQVFVRQGSLVQAPPGKGRIRSRLASFKSERESVRQCFLFSNHMIIATRWATTETSNCNHSNGFFRSEHPLAGCTCCRTLERFLLLMRRSLRTPARRQTRTKSPCAPPRRRAATRSALPIRSTQTTAISKCLSIPSRDSGTQSIWWLRRHRTRRRGLATSRSAWTTSTCTRCCRRASEPREVSSMAQSALLRLLSCCDLHVGCSVNPRQFHKSSFHICRSSSAALWSASVQGRRRH